MRHAMWGGGWGGTGVDTYVNDHCDVSLKPFTNKKQVPR